MSRSEELSSDESGSEGELLPDHPDTIKYTASVKLHKDTPKPKCMTKFGKMSMTLMEPLELGTIALGPRGKLDTTRAILLSKLGAESDPGRSMYFLRTEHPDRPRSPPEDFIAKVAFRASKVPQVSNEAANMYVLGKIPELQKHVSALQFGGWDASIPGLWHAQKLIPRADLHAYIYELPIKIPFAVAVDWILQLDKIFKILHKNNLVHRDQKTLNTMNDEDGCLILIDPEQMKTMKGRDYFISICGTPNYVPIPGERFKRLLKRLAKVESARKDKSKPINLDLKAVNELRKVFKAEGYTSRQWDGFSNGIIGLLLLGLRSNDDLAASVKIQQQDPSFEFKSHYAYYEQRCVDENIEGEKRELVLFNATKLDMDVVKADKLLDAFIKKQNKIPAAVKARSESIRRTYLSDADYMLAQSRVFPIGLFSKVAKEGRPQMIDGFTSSKMGELRYMHLLWSGKVELFESLGRNQKTLAQAFCNEDFYKNRKQNQNYMDFLDRNPFCSIVAVTDRLNQVENCVAVFDFYEKYFEEVFEYYFITKVLCDLERLLEFLKTETKDTKKIILDLSKLIQQALRESSSSSGEEEEEEKAESSSTDEPTEKPKKRKATPAPVKMALSSGSESEEEIDVKKRKVSQGVSAKPSQKAPEKQTVTKSAGKTKATKAEESDSDESDDDKAKPGKAKKPAPKASKPKPKAPEPAPAPAKAAPAPAKAAPASAKAAPKSTKKLGAPRSAAKRP